MFPRRSFVVGAMSALIAVGVLGIVGCGGGGDSQFSPFNGYYQGSVTTSRGETLDAAIRIGGEGDVAGYVQSIPLNISGTVTGSVDRSGKADIGINFAGPNEAPTLQGTGVLHLTNAGSASRKITGTLTQTVSGNAGGSAATAEITLTRNPAASGNLP